VLEYLHEGTIATLKPYHVMSPERQTYLCCSATQYNIKWNFEHDDYSIYYLGSKIMGFILLLNNTVLCV
jgi:hypothetical protein